MKISLIALIASVSASAAFAGGINEVVYEPQPVAVAPVVVAPVSDWTGFYAGAQYGQGSADVEGFGISVDAGDFDAYGLHAGYLRDFGQYVLGGELSYDRVEPDEGGEDGDLLRLKARAGADLGRFLPYITIGYGRLSADVEGEDLSEDGFLYGIGADYKVTDAISLGLEYTKQDFKDVLEDETGVSGIDLDADLIQIRASYHF